jgi:hypothetical protein
MMIESGLGSERILAGRAGKLPTDV